jgi:hypothetical protein
MPNALDWDKSAQMKQRFPMGKHNTAETHNTVNAEIKWGEDNTDKHWQHLITFSIGVAWDEDQVYNQEWTSADYRLSTNRG